MNATTFVSLSPPNATRLHWVGAIIVALSTPTMFAEESRGEAAAPNVMVILADDLGFSDVGCYGGEIATPNLDGLAAGGLRFTQFYNTARCWPTRGALLTGYYAQQIGRDKLPRGMGGYRGSRPPWARLLPEMLKSQGYRSYHAGKWHIDGQPTAGGFDRSYHTPDHSRFFNPKQHMLDGRPLPPVKPGTDYYATTAIADYAIEFLKQHEAQHADKPFFEYVAFIAPHFPLHAPAEDIARYKGKYDAGWNKVRSQRWEKIRELDLTGGTLSAVERQLGPPYYFKQAYEILGPGEVSKPLPWDELTKAQQEFQATKMEIHAAMVDRMDREIGRIVDQLKAMDALDNTLILFLSDNGASAEIMVRGDGHDREAAPGSAESYLCLGPGWSTTANTPFRRHKTWVHEGGIATPLIAHWPAGIAAKGQLRRTPGHVIDVVPTVLSLAGLDPAKVFKHAPQPSPGKSLAAAFEKDADIKRDNLWWCHEGHRAYRQGDWKIVAARGEPWELYDLNQDRCETNNLADKHPQRVQEMAAQWQQKAREFGEHAKTK